MKAGFGKVDITPRLGLEMAGFGAYLHRVGSEVRDHLYARAMAVDDGRERWVLVSCDLLGVEAATVAQARELVQQATRLAPRQVMIHAIHSHSGPATSYSVGWGEQDDPYMERLGTLIARAAIEAVQNLEEASFAYAQPIVEGIAYNRDLDERPKFEDALREDWHPKLPEHIDRHGHVLRVQSRHRLLGFISSYSCHPVVCCEKTHSLHGDYAGIATNLVESDHPGCVGLFLQGAHGDINTAICHQSQDRSMHGLNVIAARYARSIRAGLAAAEPMTVSRVAAVSEQVIFKRADWPEQKLLDAIAANRHEVISAASDEEGEGCRLKMVFVKGMRQILASLKAHGTHEVPVEMQALALGNLCIVGTPFELFRGIKERLVREAGDERLLMLSMTNGSSSYAVTRERFDKAYYAAALVPFILGICPFTEALEDEIVAAALRLLESMRKEE